MANTRKVLLSLHAEVADHLDREPNKSAVVDALAAAHYGLSFEGGSAASSNRQSLLEKMKAAATAAVAQPEPEPMAALVEVEPENVIPTTTTEPAHVAVELVGDVNATVAPQREGVQPEAAFVPVSAPDAGFVPQVQPLEAVLETEKEGVAPVVEPVQQVEPILPTDPLPTPELSLVEAVATAVEAVPAYPLLPTEPETVPEPVQVEAGPNVCPTCHEAMITPVCLNCL